MADTTDSPASSGTFKPDPQEETTSPNGGDPKGPGDGVPGERPATAPRPPDELDERLLRALAELDNVRKRVQRETEESRRRALEALFGELLLVKDSLELGLQACRGETGPVVEGLGMTLRLLETIFERYGVETIDPLHAPFDPRRHEAIATRPEADVDPGTVVVVVQKGYRFHERLLRPARVVVAAPPLDSASADPT